MQATFLALYWTRQEDNFGQLFSLEFSMNICLVERTKLDRFENILKANELFYREILKWRSAGRREANVSCWYLPVGLFGRLKVVCSRARLGSKHWLTLARARTLNRAPLIELDQT